MLKRTARQPEPATTPAWLRWRPAAWATLLGAFALIAYSNSFAGPFIFDDQTNVVDNAKIRRLRPLWDTMRAPLEAVGMAGRPVAQLSMAVNYAIHGLGVAGYHVGNFILHVAAALVLFGVVRRTLLTPVLAPRFGRHATPLAFAVALVWEVHPLLCDSVSYISARTEVLAGLLLLLTLYCAIRAMWAGPARAAWGWRAASVVSCALGTGAKEVMVAAPVIVLAYDWLFLLPRPGAPGRGLGRGSSERRTATATPSHDRAPKTLSPALSHEYMGEGARRGRAFFYLALFATLALVPLNLSMANFHRSAFARVQDQLVAFDYLKLQSQVIARYLRLSIWPEPLLIDYSGEWSRHPSLAAVLPYAAVVLLFVAATFALLVRRKPAAMLGVWFFAILAPTSSFLPLPTEIASERRMYLPLIAIVALVVLGGYSLVTCFSSRSAGVIAAVLLGGSVFGETLRTLQRNAEFKDPVNLWAAVLARQPNNRRAYSNLARELLKQNQAQLAAEVYCKSLAIDAGDPVTWNNLAAVAMRGGDWAEAERCLRAALVAKADFALAHQNLGLVYLKTNRLDEAEREVGEAIRLDGSRADRTAMLAEIQKARASSPAAPPSPTSLPASSSPSPPRP
jgi:tetratricopeptide (TPR) repeat protein